MENNVFKYLHGLANTLPDYQLLAEDNKQIEKEGLANYILRKVLSHKYRKTAITEDFREYIFKNIQNTITIGKPLRFTIPTGGYKKWQFTDIAPEVDWSEFFHLRYMIEYLSPLVSVYKPGVLLEYFSNSWLVKRISYYPQSDLDMYAASFRKLISVFEKILPPNFVIKYHNVADQITEEELLSRTYKNIPIVQEKYAKLPETQMKELLEYSDRNIRWDILEKDGKLDDRTKSKLILEGKTIHDALLEGGWNKDLYYVRNDNAIPIIHRKSKSDFLHIASCDGSFVQFWVGRGVLEKKERGFKPMILSYEQYQAVKDRIKTEEFSGIKLKNFKSIEVID
jgi:hypothetical protein